MMCTGHQPICAVWADVSIVMDHSSVLKPTLQSVLVWPAPRSQTRPHKNNITSSHFATIQRAWVLSHVALLSQEHKDFSAWFTVCEWLWTGPHAVLWCKVYVCLVEVHFYVLSLWVRRDAAVSLYAGVGFLSSTVVMMGCCSEVCGCVLHAATWVGGLSCKRTVSGGALKQRALTVLWTHTNCVYLLFG